ncbi:uncharacterized protein LOC129232383 isoform X2 [Uloborus diversus]|uniref:uncharacterized protein LOC129232383 isoform X2 n=1 Tax=Uloborus diversus TaxID=327109 RepID=UPI002408F841|nr:uncharacterized protein LOC129232383 isoform X2 [Uloborus diversus]
MNSRDIGNENEDEFPKMSNSSPEMGNGTRTMFYQHYPRHRGHVREFVGGYESESNFSYQATSSQRRAGQGRRRNWNRRGRGASRNNAYRGNHHYNLRENDGLYAPYQQECDNESSASSKSFHSASSGETSGSDLCSKPGNVRAHLENVNVFPNSEDNSFRCDEKNVPCIPPAMQNEMSFGAMASDSKSRLYDVQHAKNYYENTLKNLNLSDVIMDYRKQIDEIASKHIQQHLKGIDKMANSMKTQKRYVDVLRGHLNNLKTQQEQFEQYVTVTKVQFSSIYGSKSEIPDVIKIANTIRHDFLTECKLFKRILPGYALKSEVLNLVGGNQVSIICADNSYFLNIIIPLIIKNKFTDSIISCETNKLLTNVLRRNYSSVSNTGIDDPMSKQVNIFFLTEEELLNDLSNDNIELGNSFIAIFNMSLKRSIIADILMAKMLDLLISNKHAKLVLLLSEYDDALKYQEYFSDLEVSTFAAPKLILPVKTVWKSISLSPNDNYKTYVVNTVMSIHTLNEPGDVIVFLPSLADCRTVSIDLNKRIVDLEHNNIECILLHENSPEKECLDMSFKKSVPKRSIFLATSCAEMLVITSVRFVVDSGLRKDYFFDHHKNLDILSTTFISHAACLLRRDMAGIFAPGVCYRIYSKDNYLEEMYHMEYPEILSVNPFNTIIKVFQYNPDTATSVDFIEPIPEEIKKSTMDALKKYNAIKNGLLTTLGKQIVKLPFPPKYSKFILLGIEWGYAYEAIVLVAFFSVKGRVFRYSDNEDVQREIDAAKLQFFQEESDTLSYLYIFKKWMENGRSLPWCEDHFINADAMNNVFAKVDEICKITETNLNESIMEEFSPGNCTSSIKEMLFECFKDNLCVYTGHYKSGYRVLSSRSIAFLHPSSMICQKENLPKYILYDHMVATSREFLVDVTSVDQSNILTAVENGLIDFDYSDMFEKDLVQKIIEPVGERVIKQILLGKKGQRLKEIEKDIKSEIGSELVIVEPSAEKGSVSVYALPSLVDAVVDKVNKILSTSFNEFSNIQYTNTLMLKKGERKLPVEISWTKGAMTTDLKFGSPNSSGGVIHNNLSADASESEYSSAIQHCINLTWTRRACNGRGFVTFSNHNDFMIVRKLAMTNLHILDCDAFVQVSRNTLNQLYISELPPETKVSDVEMALKENLLLKKLPNIVPENIELKFVPSFETTDDKLDEIKALIEGDCEEFTSLVDFDVVVPSPKPSATVMKAYINVNDDTALEVAAESLCNTMLDGFKVSAIPVYRSVIKCTADVCKALKIRFQEVLPKLEDELRLKYDLSELFTFSIKLIGEDTATIKLLSNHSEIIKVLQRTVNDLLEGDVLNRNNIRDIHKLFCHGGHLWLRTLEKIDNILILEDYKSKLIRLYGLQINCNYAKKRIIQFLEDTEKESVKTIVIEKNDRKLLKDIIRNYGANLEKFIELCGLRSAILDIKSCHIKLHGSRDSIEKAEDVIRDLSKSIDPNRANDLLCSSEMCPVCDCPALNLTSRLEHCGHLYCSECIQGLIEQANFPLQCCAEECFKEIFLDDVIKILGEDTDKLKALLDKSMKHYLETHHAEIIYCPAPDCTMFFFKEEVYNKKWNCSLCQNDICIDCNVVYHQGYTCDMFQGSKSDPDYSFKGKRACVFEKNYHHQFEHLYKRMKKDQ